MEPYENILHNIMNISPPIKNKEIEKRLQLKSKESVEITYENYVSKKIVLSKCKVVELKAAAKKCKLHISGKKEMLIERIIKYYNETRFAIKIQTIFRKWLVTNMFRLRGPAFKSRSLCVNDTDFCTLEPINEIPSEKFYSVTNNNFTYGFDITSLIELLKQNTSIQNPYTRENFDNKTKNNILTLYRLSFILIPKFKFEHTPYRSRVPDQSLNRLRRDRPTTTNLHVYNPHINHITSEEMFMQHNNIRQVRTTPVANRIVQLFMAIDRLGNYTNSSWFTNLDMRSYIRLYRSLYDIWYVRSGLTGEVRNLISPFCCPFEGIFNTRTLYSELTFNQIQLACLIVMENIVYSGVSAEYRTIGAFHALSALTIVSLDARSAMPWLYESVM